MSGLIWLFAAGFAFQAQADDLSGTLTSIETVNGKQVAHFRTATENVDLDLDALPDSVKKQLSAPEAKTSIVAIKADGPQIVSRSDVPFGVRSDCSELPTSVADLDKLAKDPKTTSMVDFLKKIPAGSLQGMTFVTNSKSAQRGNETGEGKVSPMWPRALRASIDGKTTISFVCDPKNPAFGKVEVIEFNDKSKEFETTEWDFGTPEKPTPPGERVKKNPAVCLECHSGSPTNLGGKPHPSLKPNWPEYFFWGDCQRDRGITLFGASDDNMGGTYRGRLPTTSTRQPQGCDSTKDAQSIQDASADYQKFRTAQKDNECFKTLPWAKLPPGADTAPLPGSDSTKDYRFYPYAVRAQDSDSQGFNNYSLRTNARFTDGYSHYMAQRNAALLKQDPDYELMKYYLVMEEAGCINQQDRDDIAKMLGPKYQYTNTDPNRVNVDSSYSLPTSQPILYSYGKKAGIDDHDWSMEFKLKGDPDYNAVMFEGPSEGSQDSKIFNVVAGNVFREIREENPAIRDQFSDPFIKGITAVFGPRFSCIDDVGGRVKGALRRQGQSGPFCTALRTENDKRLKTLLANRDCEACKKLASTADQADKLNKQLKDLAAKVDQASAARGRELVKATGKGKCVTCHASADTQGLPDDLLFVADESAPPQIQAAAQARLKARFAEGGFMETIMQRVVEKKRMPPGGLGKDLTDQERNDIVSYIQSQIAK